MSQKQTMVCEKYIGEMEIIKLRTNLINNTLLKYLQPTIEFKALQLRKIIEQILLSSLIANSEKYKEYYGRLEKDWNARLISRDLARINPDFFPRAVYDDHVKHEIKYKSDALSCDEIIDIYERLSKLLHSQNPFDFPIDYEKENVFINNSLEKIVYLLNTHIIKPYGTDGFMFVGMRGLNSNGKAFVNWFEPI